MKLTKIEYKLTFLFAVLCSMNGLMIAGFSISNFILIALIICSLFNKRIVLNFKSESSKFVWWLLLSIILSIFAAMSMLPMPWLTNSIMSLIKFLLAYGYFFLMQPSSNIKKNKSVFFNGFYVGAIVQMVWGFLQEILYIVFSLKLNTLVFSDILGQTSYVWDSYVDGNILRMKGLGWETANFALVMIIGYIISCHQNRNRIIRLLFIVAIFFSTSRSGYVAMASVLLMQLFQSFKKLSYNYKVTYKNILSSLIFTVVIFFILIIFKNELFSRWQLISNSFSDLFQESNINSSIGIHTGYYETLIAAMKKMPIVNLLFGVGYFSSGYFYFQNASALNMSLLVLTNPLGWNPESDFITLIVGNGLFGVFIYYFFAIKAILVNRKNYEGLIAVAIVICGITYLTIRGTWAGLLLAFVVDKEAINESKNSSLGVSL